MEWFDAGTKKKSVPSFVNVNKLIKLQCTNIWSQCLTPVQMLTHLDKFGPMAEIKVLFRIISQFVQNRGVETYRSMSENLQRKM